MQGKFTTVNLLVKFMCESPKNTCVSQCPQGGEIFSTAWFFSRLVWQNGDDVKRYERYNGWAKKTNKRMLGGATVHG